MSMMFDNFIFQDGEMIPESIYGGGYASSFPDADEIEYDHKVFLDEASLQVLQEATLLPPSVSSPMRRAAALIRCATGGHLDLVIDMRSSAGLPDSEEARLVWDLNPYRQSVVLTFRLACLRCGRETVTEMVRATSLSPQVSIDQEPEEAPPAEEPEG